MPDLQQLRRRVGKHVAEPLVKALSRSPISPNQITITGIAATIVAAWLASEGRLVTSGLVLGAASLLDLLDGALARATGKVTKFGAILDSTGDRISEAAMLAGIALWFAHTDNSTAIVITYVALIASFLVSYLRARGEAMGFDCTVGLCTRPERVIVLALGLLTGFVFVAVAIVAFCSSVTVVQRLLHLQRKGKESGD
ncbi:MAG: CDP-alcohol phosphatidyltransferase family protein [Dehalococcoidia bacterium]|nr:CDP-alcohol phosphatidyltransferase family protein [Dehalococcoidia bacterium]